ncbi:hypothetical protein [Acinetobacter sp. ANC 5378]|uniref:hypothetical protein n=1 Tax=Acinetobacter sp. ANC 5378 TaxID=2731249 RepID=UPI00148FEB3B|nr:hypothetical protein [Acinetobacter sp. ANC 5378]NNG82016.1 hypothetical protein [Acinetobacter sp. ANC 5378]
MADRYKNTVDQRVCINSDGDYMAWDMQVAWHVWQAAKAQAVPEVITIGNELQSWVAAWSFSAKNDGEDYVVVDANLLAEKIEGLTGASQ